MANPIKHAKKTAENAHLQVQPYMASLFQRLGFNYAILIMIMVLINTVGVWLLLTFLPIPQSTANVIGFSVNLIFLLYGWRFLEKRNRATSLFVLYTRYSRQRRDLTDNIKLAEDGALENTDDLYIQVDVLEEKATSFLEAVESEGMKAHQSESNN